tara:strand:- start:17 stop:541 length:525 start_codon:yes stop_codon:yes gene_type:complete
MVEDEFFSPDSQAVISAPQKAPEGAIHRTESALQLLKRVKRVSEEWVRPGHREGQNTHNVSATISVKESEWVDVGEWMWENRDSYNGLSILSFNDNVYKQSPFEDCSKETYEALLKDLTSVDLNFVIEDNDNTDASGEIACAGGACEIDIAYTKELPEPMEPGTTIKSQDRLEN